MAMHAPTTWVAASHPSHPNYKPMKRISNYLKMRVLGALEYAQGSSNEARYKAVSQIVFKDEEGIPHQFTWRTIQTWWYYYRRHGMSVPLQRADKGTVRKVAPEELLEAIEKVLPFFHGKKYNIAEVYRACIEKGLLRRNQIAPNTFRRHVNTFGLLKSSDELGDGRRKVRLAFAKAHANDMWQADTLHGPYIYLKGKPTKTFLICFIDDASRVVPHGAFYTNDSTSNLIDCFQIALFKRGIPQVLYVDYVPRHIIDVLCPTALCGQNEDTATNTGRNFRGRSHNFQRDFNHFRSSVSSRQTERAGHVVEELATGGWHASKAFCFMLRLISA